MSPTVLKLPAARRDLVEIADYLEQAAGLPVADRFLDAVEQGLATIAGMPSMGSPLQLLNRRLQDVRTWSVPGFRKYLIYYRSVDAGISVLRVLHGARDADTLLEDNPG
jgi:toxin ParE1/3/4